MEPSRSTQRRILSHAALIFMCLIVGFPMIFIIVKSTQSIGQIFSYPPVFLPGNQVIANYTEAWTTGNLARLIGNTLVVAIGITLGKTVLSLTAGMAFVYFKFPFKGALFFFVLLTLMMPTDILIVSLFGIVSRLGWGNSYQALIVPFLASATGTFLFRQHFANIPAELADAAQIDGAGPIRFLVGILIPMSWNVIGALAMITFVYAWNQYLWPLLVINDNDRQLIQVALKGIAVSTTDLGNWGIALAAAVIASIPPLIVFLFFQESFLKGFALTRDK
jgi:sn-glycerol 3-phosphate transport system permease protein